VDSVTRQFIVLSKKLRKELRDGLGRIADELHKQTAATEEQNHAEAPKENPAPVIHELHVLESTIDRIKTDSTAEARRKTIQDRLATGTLGIVLAYTIFAFFQWTELNTQNINQSAANISSGITADRMLRQIEKTGNDTHILAESTKTLAGIAARTFALSRPSVVVGKIQMGVDISTGNLTYMIPMTNHSSIPATDFEPECDLFYGGKYVAPTIHMHNKGTTIAAGETFSVCQGSILKDTAKTVVTKIYVHARYRGPAGKYTYCGIEQYFPEAGIFVDMGDCDPSKPFPQ
jgi:hypothetical protein